jgi:hypothetical protein
MQEQINTPGYKGYERRGLSEHKQRHVHDHLTPLAAIIVVPGLLVANLPMFDALLAGGLICVSVVMNYLLMYMGKAEKARFYGSVRVTSNYVVNVGLLWLLYAAWPPVWLLLLLMSIGVAIYQPRRGSFRTSIAFALMLVTVHWVFGEHSLAAWTQVGVIASMLILLNLYVNGLVHRPAVQGASQAQGMNQVQGVTQVQGANQ